MVWDSSFQWCAQGLTEKVTSEQGREGAVGGSPGASTGTVFQAEGTAVVGDLRPGCAWCLPCHRRPMWLERGEPRAQWQAMRWALI